MNASAQNPEVRAAQLYDLLMDEMRTFAPTEQEAEMALCMMMAAYLSGVANSDSEVVMMVKRMGTATETYYERAKQSAKRMADAEREIIKLGDA